MNKNTTLDILEDCLHTLYKTRKANLHTKAMKYERAHQKRMVKSIGQQRPRTPNPNVDYDDAYGEDDEAFVDSLASSLTMDPMPAHPSSSSSTITNDNTINNSGSKQKKAYNYEQVKDPPKLFKTGSESFSTLGDQQDDQKAAQAFLDFRNEVEKWWNDNQLKRNDPGSRSQMADYFSEKYLAKRLDPLPGSKTVAGIRKQMSTVIEEFGSSAVLTPDWPAKAFNFTMPDDLGRTMRGGGTPPPEDVPGTDPRGPAGHQRRIASKKEVEKDIMKKQYEDYAKAKKEAEKNNAVAQEYEQHLNDIKSLIGNINNIPKLA